MVNENELDKPRNSLEVKSSGTPCQKAKLLVNIIFNLIFSNHRAVGEEPIPKGIVESQLYEIW